MTKEELMMKQQYDLDLKIQLSLVRIREFYYRNNKKVYVSFSGGKDSTVLLHLVRSEFPDVPAVFCNTGNEYPDIIKFVNTIDNVITIRPKLSLKEVIEKYGYPVISKEISEHIYSIRNYRLTEESIKRANKKIPKKWKFLLNAPFKISDLCCDYLKKNPFIKFEKETGLKPYIGLMASDSNVRRQE
ncbi:MAG: phosphoadenosine phosphosulfate reductase family protein, partial [bacterium]|nr:phosphoadenosine phosphosulfate reductase family protein [bacterium]